MSARPSKRGASSVAPSTATRHGSRTTNKRAASVSINSGAHVADVNPTYSISGTVHCAETLNDRIAWTAEGDGTLCIRALPKGTALKSLPGRPRTKCTALVYVEPLQQLWAAFGDGYVRVYSATKAQLHAEFAVTEAPHAAVTAMIEVEGVMFVAGEDGSLTQWDCRNQQRVRTLPAQLCAICCLGCYVGPTGSVVFAGSEDGSVKAWDPYIVHEEEDGGAVNALMHAFPGGAGVKKKPSPVRAIDIVSHANLMWTGSDDALVRVWNLESLECVNSLLAHSAPITTLLSVESRMWSGDAAGNVILWDINSCTPLQELTQRDNGGTRATGAILTMRKMLPSTSWKVWTASASGIVQCWSAETVPILFNQRLTPGGAKGRKGLAAAATATGADDEEIAVWRLFQRTASHGGRDGSDSARSDGRRPSLGVVDLQQLADQMGFERGRMEVQRELQTQQLLEEENAMLKRRVKKLLQLKASQPSGLPAGSPTQTQTSKPASLQQQLRQSSHLPIDSQSSSAVRPPAAPLNLPDAIVTRLRRIFPGGNWGYLMAEKPHQLREEFREEVCTALGVPGSQIVRVAFSQGSLVADVDVQHHRNVRAEEMDIRLQRYPFARLQQLHDSARATPKRGLDAAEETIVALERKLQETTGEDSPVRESPEPRLPSPAAQDINSAAAATIDALTQELREANSAKEGLEAQLQSLHHENDSLHRAMELLQDPVSAAAQCAAKDEELVSLRSELGEAQRQLNQLRSTLGSGTPLSPPLGGSAGPGAHGAHTVSSATSITEEHGAPSVELSPSPPAIDSTSNKAARPDAAVGGEALDYDAPVMRMSPSQDGLQPPRPPTASGGAEAELLRLRAEHAVLKEDYDALDKYVQETVNPMVSSLKRRCEERELDITRLKKELSTLSSPAGSGAASDAACSSSRSPSAQVDDMALLRRELRKSQCDAAAKGAALRKVQHELTVLRRAMESETGGAGAATRGSHGENSHSATNPADAVAATELKVKERALTELQSEYDALSARVNCELSPTIDNLRSALANREEQLRLAQEESTALRDALERNEGGSQERRVRDEKVSEAVEALRSELDNERTQRLRAESLLKTERFKTTMASGDRGNVHGLEAQNLALSVRLADAESVVAELRAFLEQVTGDLEEQRRETERLNKIIADNEEGSDGY